MQTWTIFATRGNFSARPDFDFGRRRQQRRCLASQTRALEMILTRWQESTIRRAVQVLRRRLNKWGRWFDKCQDGALAPDHRSGRQCPWPCCLPPSKLRLGAYCLPAQDRGARLAFWCRTKERAPPAAEPVITLYVVEKRSGQ